MREAARGGWRGGKDVKGGRERARYNSVHCSRARVRSARALPLAGRCGAIIARVLHARPA